MKIVNLLIILLVSLKTFGQVKPMVFYNETGEKFAKQEFSKTKDYSKNLDLYFENDSIQIGLLVTREKFGHLDQKTFNNLKTYLTQISGKQIDPKQNIVINYLTFKSGENDDYSATDKWDIFDRDYLKKLHKVENINQFWISSANADNLDYSKDKHINSIADKEGIFQILFFPYEVRYGNFLLIKPDGRYYYYLGEHSKRHIWEKSKKYFK